MNKYFLNSIKGLLFAAAYYLSTCAVGYAVAQILLALSIDPQNVDAALMFGQSGLQPSYFSKGIGAISLVLTSIAIPLLVYGFVSFWVRELSPRHQVKV